MTQWLSAYKTAKLLGTHPQTLRTWSSKGLIETIRTPGNHRLYNVESFSQQGKEKEKIGKEKERKTILYARVSSSHQRSDLDRQIQDLQKHYPSSTTISDIGSALNYRRKGLQRILRLVCQGFVSTIVVAHRDRLCRFGYELFETLFQHLGVEIVVLNQEHSQENGDGKYHEIMDDILSINSFFIARMQGQRAAEHRKYREHQSQVKITKTPREILRGKKTKTSGISEVRQIGNEEFSCPIVF